MAGTRHKETSADEYPVARVGRELRRRVLEGVYAPGDRVPTERELETEFGVSRLTVAKALAPLVAEGLIVRQRGRGSYVTHRRAGRRRESAVVADDRRLITFISPGASGGSGGGGVVVERGVLEGMHAILGPLGYRVGVDFYRDSQQQLRCLERYQDRAPAAFVVWPEPDEGVIQKLRAMTGEGFPVVLVDTYLEQLDCDYVVSDNGHGGRAMVEHLVALGHRRISYLGEPPVRSSLIDRLGGFLSATVAAGLPIDANTVVLLSRQDRQGLSEAIDRLLQAPEPPTALFCAHDQVAMSVAYLLRERGRRVPQDVTLVGYDNIDAAADFYVPLTTVAQDFYEMGRLAAEILLYRINGGDMAVPYQVHVRPRLIQRASGAAPPGHRDAALPAVMPGA
ncbi:MAG: GntR family transcriptional regulator [Phycisphaeraceae bacterium]|nr:GntR family transcriptional regulator [Phycisphaeraceae bacterium]